MQPPASSPPLSETRFFRGGNVIYKFHIRCNSGYRRQGFHQELEKIIRTVLGSLVVLQPFSSLRFNVFPYKRQWSGAARMMCCCHERDLKVFPFTLVLNLEEKGGRADVSRSRPACSREDRDTKVEEESERSPPASKRGRSEWPLEGATLQELMKALEEDSRIPVISRVWTQEPAVEEAEDSGGDIGETPESGAPSRAQETPRGTSEEESEEEGEAARPGSETKPGFLTRMASYIFPFSLLVKEP